MSDTDATQRAAGDRERLRRVQLGVLGLLALCALAIFAAAEASDLGYADRRFTLGALMLGGGSILARGRALMASDSRTRVWLAAAAMILAGGIGVLGAVLAVSQDERGAGLLYTLGGALLALRGSAPRSSGAAPSTTGHTVWDLTPTLLKKGVPPRPSFVAVGAPPRHWTTPLGARHRRAHPRRVQALEFVDPDRRAYAHPQALEYVGEGVSGARDRRPALDDLIAAVRRRGVAG